MSTDDGQDTAVAYEPEWCKRLRVQQAQAMSIINGLKEHPPELLDEVLKAIMASTRVLWRPSDCPRGCHHRWAWMEPSMEMGLNDCFEWPLDIEPAVRQVFNQRAAPIFLRKAIIELPARFTMQGSTMVLDVPRAIRGHEHDVRYAVSDVLIARRGAYQAGLNRMITHMGDIKELFPNLQSCVICVNFTSLSSYSLFDAQMLDRANQMSYTQSESLRVSLYKLVNTFHTRGPGSHKLVRLGQHIGPFNRSRFGPLVDVNSIAAQISRRMQ